MTQLYEFKQITDKFPKNPVLDKGMVITRWPIGHRLSSEVKQGDYILCEYKTRNKKARL